MIRYSKISHFCLTLWSDTDPCILPYKKCIANCTAQARYPQLRPSTQICTLSKRPISDILNCLVLFPYEDWCAICWGSSLSICCALGSESECIRSSSLILWGWNDWWKGWQSCQSLAFRFHLPENWPWLLDRPHRFTKRWPICLIFPSFNLWPQYSRFSFPNTNPRSLPMTPTLR